MMKKRIQEKQQALDSAAKTVEVALSHAAFTVESMHHFHNATECLCGFDSPRARSRTEHITQALLSEFRRFTGQNL